MEVEDHLLCRRGSPSETLNHRCPFPQSRRMTLFPRLSLGVMGSSVFGGPREGPLWSTTRQIPSGSGSLIPTVEFPVSDVSGGILFTHHLPGSDKPDDLVLQYLNHRISAVFTHKECKHLRPFKF